MGSGTQFKPLTLEFRFITTMLRTKEPEIVFGFQFWVSGKLNELKPSIYLEIHR